MKKTVVMGLFLAAAMLGAAAVFAGVQNTVASEIGDPDENPGIGDPNENSARDFAPGIRKGFDPQPEPPGRDSSARDFAPGQTEIGDPNAVAPGNLKKIIK